jgi:hypothetical protein
MVQYGPEDPNTINTWPVHPKTYQKPLKKFESNCKGNLTDLRRELHLSLAKGNPK